MYRRIAVTLAYVAFATILPPAQTKAPVAQHLQPPKPTQPLVQEAPAALSTKVPAAEDWTSISLAKSGLPTSQYGGLVLSKTETPEFTRELLRVQWRPNDPIDLYVVRPRNVEKPPVILYLYNYTSDTDRFRSDEWCRRATQNGFAAVGFVSALSGQRFHSPRPMREWFVSELQEALSTSTHDVQMVLNYLNTRGDLDMKGVGMFGQGSGGSVAILAAAVDFRIVALDVIDPFGDWPDWLKGSKQIPEEERSAYLAPTFLQKIANLDPVSYLPQLKVKALRIQQVMDNPVTPSVAKDKIAAAAPKPDDVKRYQDLAAYDKALNASGHTVWLQEQLRPRTMTTSKLQ